jgi:integrase
MADRNGGLVYTAEGVKLGEYLTSWLRGSEDTVRRSTFSRYEQISRVHLRPALGSLKLRNLSPAHVRDLYRQKLDSGLSPRTVRYIHVTLHKALKQAVRDGLIPRNATEAVKPPRPSRREMRPLSPAEVGRFLEAARGDEHEAIFVLAVSSGMRQGELLALRWEDADLEAGTLRVQRSLSHTKDGPVFAPPRAPRAAGASSSPARPSRPSNGTGRSRAPTGLGWAPSGRIGASSSRTVPAARCALIPLPAARTSGS